jgi:DNA-directed RNA polymerase subunit alpha
MENISLPEKIFITADANDPKKGTVTIEPLYPGYGATIGNALRRVLLSSLPGAAIYAFKIKGVKHEFSTIDFVKEDAVDIALNLKSISVKSFSAEPVKLELEASGVKTVTAGDIKPNSDIVIPNPEQIIMTLTDKAAKIEMVLWVKPGRGYEPVESRPDDNLEVNAIAIDAIYAPVRQVVYAVENIRVGGRTDYDKVAMQIETNGAVTIDEAVRQAAQILSDHFNFIVNRLSAATESAPEEPSSESGSVE